MNKLIEFFNTTTMKEWFFLFLGGVIGYFLNFLFYLKSQKSASEKNFDRLLDLYNKIIEKDNGHSLLAEVREEIRTKITLENIHNELIEVKAKLDVNVTDRDVLKYKLLGEKWSNEYLYNIKLKILTKDGKLYFENLLEFHKTIFPSGFPWAGKFRDHDVIISSSFTTMTATRLEGLANYNLKPIDHKRINESLHEYCTSWNNSIPVLLSKPTGDKITVIAKEFHEFLVIHPFTDGNGRVARTLVSDMIEFLLNSHFNFRFDRQEYNSALRLADMGNYSALEKFIEDNIG